MKTKLPLLRAALAALLRHSGVNLGGCLALSLALANPRVLALEGAIGVHDPSTVAICDGKYYVYGTGRGVSVLTSTNLWNWERGERVFDRIPESVSQYVPKNTGSGIWAPDIIKVDDQYYLYYAVSAWGQYVSAIGLMTSPKLDPNHPDYKWTDRGMVVHSIEGQALNAIDPGVVRAPDGSLWIAYGSYHGNIELVELDPKTGLRMATNSPVYIPANHSEAVDIIHRGDYFYLFVNQGSCCQDTNSAYHIRVGRSPNVQGPYLDRHGVDLNRGGGTLFVASAGTQVGPGHFGFLQLNGVEKFSCHYEGDIAKGGRSFLEIRPLLWTLDGWPLPGENVKEGTYQIRSQRTGTVLQGRTGATNGPIVQTTRYLVRAAQQWKISPAGGGLYQIAVSDSDAALGAAAGGGLELTPFTGADNQLWRIDQLSDGCYRVAATLSKQVLTATIKTEPGNGVALEPFTGDDAQRWVITAP
jgi:arabinan endo-1,5-alpha-L-arabinosidase